MDHTRWAENSVDLSDADWETFDPQKYDYDNPEVPNLLSINPDMGPEWMVTLARDAVLLATGENWRIEDYVQSSGTTSQQIVILWMMS